MAGFALEAQGLSRDVARYNVHDKADVARTLDYRQQLETSGTKAYEQLHTYAGWQDQAVKLLSLDRQYVKDLCRDHMWRYDRSPTRELERQQSMVRTLDVAMEHRPPHQRPERHRGAEHTHARTPTRDRAPSLAHQVRGLAHALDDEPLAGVGLRLKVFDREREQDRGIGW